LALSLLLPRIAAAAPAPPDALDLDALMARMAGVAERRAAFREEKRLAALTEPLVSTGRLHYLRLALLEKITEAPTREILRIDGERVEMQSGEDAPKTLDLAAAPELRALVDAVRAPLAGDLATLRRDFVVGCAGTPEAWAIELTPADARLGRFLRLIRLEGAGTDILLSRTVQANGDALVIQIRPLP
jgi:hypothetical protein